MRHVAAVLQVIRHTRTKGMGTSVAGFGLSMRRGEETADFFTNHHKVAPAITRRGLAYIALTSPLQRATETEQQVYQGFVSSRRIAKLKKGGFVRQLSSIADVAKTPKGEDAYKRGDMRAFEAATRKLHDGEEQKLFAESLGSVRDRAGVITGIEEALRGADHAKKSPVPFVNIVSHSLTKMAGPVELMLEHLAGLKPKEYGGVFQHTEGFRRVIYSDGSVETHILRQNQEKSRAFKTRRVSSRRR